MSTKKRFSNQPVKPSQVISAGWKQVIYLDANYNGQIDAGEVPVSGAISVTAGQTVCILVKEFVPAQAPFNAQDLVLVTASFTYVNAVPALVASVTQTDLTTVGDVLTYTITYINLSSDPLNNINIFDQTPAYTKFVGAAYGALPSNLTSCAITSPATNTTGAIQWFFSGSLTGGGTGTVSFAVQVD